MASLDAAAAGIATALAEEWSEGDMVRLLAEAVHEFELLEGEDDRIAYLAEPRTTGDIGWDAALAALAVHLVRLAGMTRTPDWTRDSGRYSPEIRWIGLPDGSDMQAFVFQRTPVYFKARGVMLNEANLVSV
jgi:hypothetical protein